MPVASWRCGATLHQRTGGQWIREETTKCPFPKRQRKRMLGQPLSQHASDSHIYLPGIINPISPMRKQRDTEKK